MLRHTTSEKIPELTRCFRWFAGLCVLNILTFWVPFIWASSGGRNAVIEWGLVVGLAVTGVVMIYFIHRLSRFAESRAVWFYLPFALVPFFSVVVLLLLAARSSAEVTRLGGYARLLPPRVSAGLVALAILAFGLLLLYMQVSEDIDHVRLKRGGQPITGTLRMVTKHSVNFIPTSKSFDVEYAGRRKTFYVSGAIYDAHTVAGGRFIEHALPVIYLPSDPGVAELPGTPGFSVGSLFQYIFGGALAFFGGKLFSSVARTKSGWGEGVPR